MHITMEELRDIKHQLPTGSVARIAQELGIEEQTVRNYFGAHKYNSGEPVGSHVQPGPSGGFVKLEDTAILDLARRIISESRDEDSD